MHSFKTNLLAGVSALLAAAALVSPASAQTSVYGGGSSLIGPYLARTFDCQVASTSGDVHLYNSGAAQTFNACPAADINGSGPTSASVTDIFNYLISSSGSGIKGFLTQVPGDLGTFPSGISFGSVTFAASDSPLTADDVSTYNTGAADVARGITSPITAPVTARGDLIQVPLSIDPVALGYNAQYAAGKSFTIHTADGHIHLDAAAYCGIFTHTITTWDAAALTTLNGGMSLTGTDTNVPITLVGRLDGSGTTNIFTRHLASVCGSTTANPYFVTGAHQFGASTLPTSLQSSFSLQSGSGGVATKIGTTPGAIGYIGSDYTTFFTSESNATTQVIEAAKLINHNDSVAYWPNGANATLAFTHSGLTVPSAPGDKWVPDFELGDPSQGYPMVGTTQGLFYSHYDQDTHDALVAQTANFDPYDGFLTWYYNSSSSDDVLSRVGLAPLPSATGNNWKAAIASFVTSSIVTP